MASSGKFDLSSVSPDRRGSHTAASIERSASFRENIENPILSSLPSMSRSTSTISQVDVTNFLQCLRSDPKSMAIDHKFNRHGDFKRLAIAAIGSPEEPLKGGGGKLLPSSPEELKRLKVGLRESSIKARERVKIFSESLSVINKCFPSIPSRKRSRPDDRSSGLLLNRAATGASVGKMGAFEFDQQKVEERGKNVIPNKRTRTSMVDQRAEVRPNTPARSSGNEALRSPNNNALSGDGRVLPIVSDGWEKAKMKKKRTGIKAGIDGYREPKQGMHPRLNDSHGFRPGAVNGVVGVGKTDGTSQQVVRSSIPRPEQDNTSVLHDKRDRSTSSEKERTNLRSVNKPNVREEFVSGSPTSSTKLHTGTRGPRSGPSFVPKASMVAQRATASGDWQPTNKNPGAFGSTNRKRTPSTRSSSPPVAQWADRRPQKMSRTARRTNLVPILSNNDEVPALDTSDVTENGFVKRFPANSVSPQRFKSKGDHFPLSESEESGAVEIRSRDKCKKSDEVEQKPEQNVQKLSNLVLPTRKNKLVNGEDVDGVRRQGRTGRGYASARGGASMPVRNVGTAKQLRTAKIGFDKSESKSGRPPTRKLSDRKAYTRQKHTAIHPAADFLVGSEDGNDELLTAANAVMNRSTILTSPFWRQMELLFGFISDADISYLKQHIVDNSGTFSNGTESRGIEPIPQLFAPETGEISLCQRLLSALISEGNDDLDVYESAFELESNAFNHGGRNAFGGSFSDHSYNGIFSEPVIPSGVTGSEHDYGGMSINERILVEMQNIGLYPELVPDLAHTGNEDISAEISRLEEKHHEQVSRKKIMLESLLKSVNEARELQEKDFEQNCLDKLTGMACRKYMSCRGPNAPGGKSVNGKMAKQAALAFVKRTLDRCRELETTGKSCFSESPFHEIFRSGSSHFNNAQLSPSINDLYSPDQAIGKDDIWSNRSKKRELHLDDVVAGGSLGPTILISAKGKRTERVPPGNVKGERKTKTKPKQKTTHLSASMNAPIGKISNQNRSIESKNIENDDFEEPPLDFSHLQLPEMDYLGDQGQDIGSWLNIDEDVLQDDDFMGLEIPMDDLSDLNMMV